MATQAERILARLKAEGELTNVQLNQMGIFRFGARIFELRRQGHAIESIHDKGGLWRFRYTPPDPVCAVTPPIQPVEESIEEPDQLALGLDLPTPMKRRVWF